MIALCCGALAITASLILDSRHASHANGRDWRSAIAMIAAAAAGLVTTLRLDVNADYDDVHAGGATHHGVHRLSGKG